MDGFDEIRDILGLCTIHVRCVVIKLWRLITIVLTSMPRQQGSGQRCQNREGKGALVPAMLKQRVRKYFSSPQ